jgi:PAS domain S-box-containing protein
VGHRGAGVLVVGLNPFRQFNTDYQSFLSLIASQIGASLTVAKAYEEERKRAEALAEIDQAKTAFFSNVSHEFRTPLTLMLGPIEELLKETSPNTTRDQLETVHRNGLRLLKLVNTLLDFSRIEAGRVQVNYEQVNLTTLTQDLASAFRSLIEKAGLKFTVECKPMGHPAYVDKEMWEKIIFNLLSNAFKFTFEGGIELRLESTDKNAILTVEDTGAGIPSRELPNIFKRFHRVQNVRARTYEGSGIGLSLVVELVKLHGGDITVSSQPGEGSSFQVTIPLGKSHLPAHESRQSSALRTTLNATGFIDEALHWSSCSTPQRSNISAKQTAFGEALPRIIVADDNADMREYVARLLRERYEVETVSDGVAALEAARRSRPAAIVTDVMMPAMDGFELLGAIRKSESLKTVPVILLSARAGDEARLEGLEHQADDYLVKPFSGRELITRLETHLKLLQSREEMYRSEERLRDETRKISDRLESILSSMDDHFLILNHDFRFLYVNDRLLQANGKTRQELIGRTIWDAFPEVASGFFREQLTAAARERNPTRFEYFYRIGARWYDNRVHPTPEGLAILATDITERKQAEERATTLAAAVESSDDAIITKTLHGIITSWNNGAKRLFGYTEKEAIGQPVTMLIPADRQHEEPSILENIRAGRRIDHYETVRKRKDGTLVDISLTVSPILNDRGENIGASKIARDITAQKAARKALEDETRVLELLNDTGAAISSHLELQSLVQLVTDAGTKLSGARFGAFFYNVINEQGEAYVLYTLSGAPREAFEKFGVPRNTPVFEPTFRGQGAVRSDDITQDPRYGTMAPHYGMPKGHLPVRSYLAVPVISRSGEVIGGLFFGHPEPGVFTARSERLVVGIAAQAAIAIDNARLFETAQKEIAERKRTEAALQEAKDELEERVAERTASLSQAVAQMEEFSYSASHDLRAPVRAMQGYAQALLDDYGHLLDDTGRDYLNHVIRSGSRMDRLVREILTYSRLARAELNLLPVSLDELIPDIIKHYPAMQPPQANIALLPGLGRVMAHEPSLTQAISNLLSNAVKFVAAGVTPSVKVSSERRDDQIRLWIQDNGIGIKPEHQGRLFGLFQRIHPEDKYEGTGVGLAIVRKSIERMGGKVGLESNGVGSRFWIELPGASSA